MKITINGKTKTIDAPLKVQRALKDEGYEGKIVSVAVNGTFVPKAQYTAVSLYDGDEIEIVAVSILGFTPSPNSEITASCPVPL